MPERAPFQSLFDSLQLNTACGLPEPSASQTTSSKKKPTARPVKSSSTLPPTTGIAFYVSPTAGNDSNPGTLSSPFQSIPRAIEAARALAPSPRTIFLREGFYFLAETIQLGPQDSNLAFVNYANEVPVISGGIPLDLAWEEYIVSPPSCTNNTCIIPNLNNVYDEAYVDWHWNVTSTEQCSQLCQSLNCTSFTYFGTGGKNQYIHTMH